MSQPLVLYDRLRASLCVEWLAEDLVLIVLPGGYRLAVGWFGQLEGDGHFELSLTGRSGLELYRGRYGRDPRLIREMIDLISEMYTDAAPKTQSAVRSA